MDIIDLSPSIFWDVKQTRYLPDYNYAVLKSVASIIIKVFPKLSLAPFKGWLLRNLEVLLCVPQNPTFMVPCPWNDGEVPINDVFHTSQGTFCLLSKYLNVISLQVSELTSITQQEKSISHLKYKNTRKITVILHWWLPGKRKNISYLI